MARRRFGLFEQPPLIPAIGPDMNSLLDWLDANGLTRVGGIYDHRPGEAMDAGSARDREQALAQPTNRRACEPLRPAELKALKEKFKETQLEGLDNSAVWNALSQRDRGVRSLSWPRMPADAMAFYRPFHLEPFSQWGIYLLVRPLLRYHADLVAASAPLRMFSPETLMHLVLFEVFNHEFFHHLVESTATTLEIVYAARGEPIPLYLEYFKSYGHNGFVHPHAPLEEALANAYAYNALGFISRVKVGFKTASVKAYQKAIQDHWHHEPAGYCEAGWYTGAGYVDGGAVLLAELLQEPLLADRVPLGVISKHVMPSGFTALMAKPDIPTWLVGSPEELDALYRLVPAPNEAYTQLFWPYDTKLIDEFIAKRAAEEKAKRAANAEIEKAQAEAG